MAVEDEDQDYQAETTTYKKPAAKTSLGERRGSRFDLNKVELQTGDEEQQSAANALYRPEFGKPAAGQEKIWELMSSYIGHD